MASKEKTWRTVMIAGGRAGMFTDPGNNIGYAAALAWGYRISKKESSFFWEPSFEWGLLMSSVVEGQSVNLGTGETSKDRATYWYGMPVLYGGFGWKKPDKPGIIIKPFGGFQLSQKQANKGIFGIEVGLVVDLKTK